MATKRRLYKPAPKTIIGDKKTRKPLVQGRLVTNPTHFNVGEPHLVQGQSLVHDDSADDPTIQPVKSLPVLTENMSPRLEPLHCLDLSDTDVDVTEATDMSRPKPVMVFDASHLGDSPHSAEVDVLVAYEASPARVICHTPGKLERSLRAERALDHSTTLSGGDGPNWHVKVDRVQNFGDATPKHSQNLSVKDKENLKKIKETGNRLLEASEHFQSRVIIEEILKQELGNSNMEAISLYSEASPQSSHYLTNSAPSSEKTKHQPENKSSEGLSSLSVSESQKTDLRSGSPVTSGSVKKKKNVHLKNKAPSFPQPKFEDESDASIDHVPVKDSVQNQQTKLHSEYSDSETCSLNEYVTPNKSQSKQVGFNKIVAASNNKNFKDGEQAEASLSVKKKKMRKVPSRYMQGSLNKTITQTTLVSQNSSAEASLYKSNLRSQAYAPASGKHVREKQHVEARSDVRSKKTGSGKLSRTNSVVPMKTANTQTRQPVIIPAMQSFVRNESPQEVLRSSEFHNSEQKTSTPTHDQTCLLSQDIDASAIHSVSAVSINMSVAGLPQHGLSSKENTDNIPKNLNSEKLSGKKNTNRPTTELVTNSTSDTSQLQLDLEYTRYLQWAFLNSKAKKMFQEQEKDTVAQIHALWQLLESKREESARLKLDVARLKKITLVDNILDKMEPELDTLTSLIPQVVEDYSRLGAALDTTRHQLPSKDVYIPQGGTEIKDVYEEKLEIALKESEQLLDELSALSTDKLLPLSQYLDNVEAIDRSVSSTYTELQGSQSDVTALKGLTTRFTSLCVQDMQV